MAAITKDMTIGEILRTGATAGFVLKISPIVISLVIVAICISSFTLPYYCPLISENFFISDLQKQ